MNLGKSLCSPASPPQQWPALWFQEEPKELAVLLLFFVISRDSFAKFYLTSSQQRDVHTQKLCAAVGQGQGWIQAALGWPGCTAHVLHSWAFPCAGVGTQSWCILSALDLLCMSKLAVQHVGSRCSVVGQCWACIVHMCYGDNCAAGCSRGIADHFVHLNDDQTTYIWTKTTTSTWIKHPLEKMRYSNEFG